MMGVKGKRPFNRRFIQYQVLTVLIQITSDRSLKCYRVGRGKSPLFKTNPDLWQSLVESIGWKTEMLMPLTNRKTMAWLETARSPLLAGDYAQLVTLYEAAIAQAPTEASHYWYLGLAYLLQGLEEEAQGSWMAGMAEGDPASLEAANQALADILALEAQRQIAIAKPDKAWRTQSAPGGI
jgi:tetratricopeptide (TPR) repeat protein